MHIRIIRQCILFVLLGLVGSVSVAEESQFCVINNVKDVVLTVAIYTKEEDAGIFTPEDSIGVLGKVGNMTGMTSSAHPYSGLYNNKGCIVLERGGVGHAVSAGSAIPLFPGEKPPSPSTSLTVLTYHIAVKSGKGNYADIPCTKTYPTEWTWPDSSVATVSLKDGKMACDLEINPVAGKR